MARYNLFRFIGLSLILPAGIASAQVAGGARQVDRFERQVEQTQRDTRVLVDPSVPPEDRALLDYGGLLSVGGYSIDDPAGHNHVLGQYDLIGYARLNLDGVHEFFLRETATYQSFNEGDSFDGRGDDMKGPYLDRAHYRFDLARALAAYDGKVVDYNAVVQAGRQLVHWANGVTLDEVIDGGTVHLSKGAANLDIVAGVTYSKIVDFDISRPGYRDDTDRGVYGGMLSVQSGRHVPFFYGLVQRDDNGPETTTRNEVTTRYNYNSYYLGAGSAGALTDNLLYGFEIVYEGGGGLSSSSDESLTQLKQTNEDISAFAADGRLDYLFPDANHSRVGAELILASGDSDRFSSNTTIGGNRSGTDDHGFNAFSLLNTGLAFAPAVSNLIVVRVGGSTFPWADNSKLRGLQVGADFFVFNKFLEHAPIDEPTNDHRFLGVEGDIYITWQIASDVTASIRYGGFIPGPSIEGDSGLRNFVFAGVTYAF